MTVTSATSDTSTTTTDNLANLAWTRVSIDSEEGHQSWMSSVVALDARLVAVGTDLLNGDADAAVWVSSDGLTWSRVPHDEVTFGGDGWQSMHAVAAFDGGVVAVGEDRGSDGGHIGAVWVSTDGVSWRRVRDESAFKGSQGQTIYDLVAHGSRIVAVGVDIPRTEGGQALQGDLGGAAVWISDDGSTWTRIAPDQFAADTTRLIHAVASRGTAVVAVGFGQTLTTVNPAVWISTEGLSWRSVESEVLQSPVAESMTALTATSSGFVAMGSSGIDVAVWTTANGTDWERVALDPNVFGGTLQDHLTVTSVEAFGRGLVAVGHVSTDNDLEDAVVWISPDGIAWARLSDSVIFGGPGQQMMEAVASFAGYIVAVGRDGSGVDLRPGVWIARP
ncbi:MAG: hypothetical protein KJ956_08815 [Actinobacteria bacterium]|nr:hypothetical protein [Actinomycetota bacterium]